VNNNFNALKSGIDSNSAALLSMKSSIEYNISEYLADSNGPRNFTFYTSTGTTLLAEITTTITGTEITENRIINDGAIAIHYKYTYDLTESGLNLVSYVNNPDTTPNTTTYPNNYLAIPAKLAVGDTWGEDDYIYTETQTSSSSCAPSTSEEVCPTATTEEVTKVRVSPLKRLIGAANLIINGTNTECLKIRNDTVLYIEYFCKGFGLAKRVQTTTSNINVWKYDGITEAP
jgi:hypothetical protein